MLTARPMTLIWTMWLVNAGICLGFAFYFAHAGFIHGIHGAWSNVIQAIFALIVASCAVAKDRKVGVKRRKEC